MKVIQINYLRRVPREQYGHEEISVNICPENDDPSKALEEGRTLVLRELGLKPQSENKLADKVIPVDQKPVEVKEEPKEEKKERKPRQPKEEKPVAPKEEKKEESLLDEEPSNNINYNKDIKGHKGAFIKALSEVLDEQFNPEWIKDDAIKAQCKGVSEYFIGKNFASVAPKTAEGFALLDSFKAELKTYCKANVKK
jgi:hypothetical protein